MAVINSLIFPNLSIHECFEPAPWMPPTIRDQIMNCIPALITSMPKGSKEIILSSLGGTMKLPMKPIWVAPDEDGVLK